MQGDNFYERLSCLNINSKFNSNTRLGAERHFRLSFVLLDSMILVSYFLHKQFLLVVVFVIVFRLNTFKSRCHLLWFVWPVPLYRFQQRLLIFCSSWSQRLNSIFITFRRIYLNIAFSELMFIFEIWTYYDWVLFFFFFIR